jgi:hypothetical protein
MTLHSTYMIMNIAPNTMKSCAIATNEVGYSTGVPSFILFLFQIIAYDCLLIIYIINESHKEGIHRESLSRRSGPLRLYSQAHR